MPRSTSRTRTLVACLIVLVILIIIAAVRAARIHAERYLSGMWVGDPSFLEKADLRDMQLFIAPPGSGRQRQGYLLMANTAGDIIWNGPIDIRSSGRVANIGSAMRSAFRCKRDLYSGRFDIAYDDPNDGAGAGAAPPPMPTQMRVAVSLEDGSLTLFDSDTVYAFLHKDLVASAAAVESYLAEQ
jgi:hypothetical protein